MKTFVTDVFGPEDAMTESDLRLVRRRFGKWKMFWSQDENGPPVKVKAPHPGHRHYILIGKAFYYSDNWLTWKVGAVLDLD